MDNENKKQEFDDLKEEFSEYQLSGKKQKLSKTDKILKEIWEWIYTIAIALAVVFVIKGFLFDIVKVEGSSMWPTLVDGDRLIVTKLGYKPEAGDIVILDSTYKDREIYLSTKARQEGKEKYSFTEKIFTDVPDYLKKRYYVKRIIALPGQTVDLKDGKVYVDGELLQEEYYKGITSPIDSNMSFPLVVDEDTVFVMGDNRPHSQDSRSSILGLVPYDALLGKAQVRIWPLTEISITR